MDDDRAIAEYNYAHFDHVKDETPYQTLTSVGQASPDFEATLLDTGETAKLSDYWASGDLVIEFGFLT